MTNTHIHPKNLGHLQDSLFDGTSKNKPLFPYQLPGIKGKNALVTGANQGIGKATCQLLEQLGANVIPLDLPDHNLQELEKIEDWVNKKISKYGNIDILFNNAGITNMGDIVETPLQEVHEVIDINLKAPFMLMKAVIPSMIKAGGGAIINNSSDQAFIGKRFSAVYGATKAAVSQLTKSAALDWASNNIRINCIAPGSTDTPMLRRVLKDLHQKYPSVYPTDAEEFYKQSIPLKRFAHPLEIAWLVAFLASDASSFITGVTIPIDGGFTSA